MTPDDVKKSEALITAKFVEKGFPAADISVKFSAGTAGQRTRSADTIKVTVTIKVDEDFSLADFNKGANKMGDTKFSIAIAGKIVEHTVNAADIESMVRAADTTDATSTTPSASARQLSSLARVVLFAATALGVSCCCT